MELITQAFYDICILPKSYYLRPKIKGLDNILALVIPHDRCILNKYYYAGMSETHELVRFNYSPYIYFPMDVYLLAIPIQFIYNIPPCLSLVHPTKNLILSGSNR